MHACSALPIHSALLFLTSRILFLTSRILRSGNARVQSIASAGAIDMLQGLHLICRG